MKWESVGVGGVGGGGGETVTKGSVTSSFFVCKDCGVCVMFVCVRCSCVCGGRGWHVLRL